MNTIGWRRHYAMDATREAWATLRLLERCPEVGRVELHFVKIIHEREWWLGGTWNEDVFRLEWWPK